MAQALAPHHDLTILSWWPVDVDPINRFFGTALSARPFTRTWCRPHGERRLVRFRCRQRSSDRSADALHRRIAANYDIVMGAHNETDYGRRGIE